MSIRLLLPQQIHECDVCHGERWGSWRELAAEGWRSHPVHGHDPIKLCPTCADLIAARRNAVRDNA